MASYPSLVMNLPILLSFPSLTSSSSSAIILCSSSMFEYSSTSRDLYTAMRMSRVEPTSDAMHLSHMSRRIMRWKSLFVTS
eukprot:CAMPEP_0182467946 /NCGR_PEP_ID=MMETSP1319-20130603/14755_1 /TAXON_ID=172717 /ORGANISM="Bolidomonas pacifica, Strain RCC208" /LENGTH=80 /DNA_ID=CAMNT_0024668097 /DNA_START=54 /DNA_END=293 /DNA_ORIENTATION=+